MKDYDYEINSLFNRSKKSHVLLKFILKKKQQLHQKIGKAKLSKCAFQLVNNINTIFEVLKYF